MLDRCTQTLTKSKILKRVHGVSLSKMKLVFKVLCYTFFMITIVPLFVSDTEAFREDFAAAVASSCDWIELRLDRMLQNTGADQVIRLLKALDAGSKTLLHTIRTSREGGEAEIEDEDYAALVKQLYELPGLVDVELSRIPAARPDRLQQTVLSFHDFSGTPEDETLDRIWKQMDQIRPAYEKIAVMPAGRQDVIRVLESCARHRTEAGKIAISMGEMGMESRISGDDWGSCATFCTLKEASAPGQLSLEEWNVKRSGKTGPVLGQNGSDRME